MKILIVKYLPSGENSNTLQLLNHFKKSVKHHIVEELDLLENPPMYHNISSMKAYKQRNFDGQSISEELKKAIEPMDKLTVQFKNSDLIVLATPMHNFSLPGIIKTYFDAIMQRGQVFKYDNDKQSGLMDRSKFLILYTSMGSYKDAYGFMDNLKTIMKIELDFMGFKEYEFVHAATGNKFTIDVHIKSAIKQLNNIINKWL